MSLKPQTNTSQSPELSRSLVFWAALFVALGLYGLAVLSPKLAGREELLSKHHAQQIQLLRDEQKLTRLQQVAASLQQDSRFAEELLGHDPKSHPQGNEEIIPLEGNLIYREKKPGRDASAALTNRNPPWYAPLLTAVGNSSDIRGVLLLSSVALILFAFGFLQLPDSPAENSDPKAAGEVPRQLNVIKKWLARYDRSNDDAERQKLRERLAKLESDADWDKDALPIDSLDDRQT